MSLVSRSTVVGVRHHIDGSHDGVFITLTSVFSSGHSCEGNDILGQMELIHGVVAVDSFSTSVLTSRLVIAEETSVTSVDIEVDGNVAGDILGGVVDGLCSKRHVDPSNSRIEECRGVADRNNSGGTVALEKTIIEFSPIIVVTSIAWTIGALEEVVERTQHLGSPTTGIV